VPPVVLTNSYDSAGRRTRLDNTMTGAAATGLPLAATAGFLTYASDDADRVSRIQDGFVESGSDVVTGRKRPPCGN
jgi:hypothetical protein